MARMAHEETNAVNIVIGNVPRKADPVPRGVARVVEILANRAHNAVQAGWGEDAVRRQWPKRQESPTAECRDG